FACGLSTGLGAAMNTAKVASGSTCVVFGAGMVGLGAVAGCRLQGADRIVCIDLSEDRLALARRQGATDAFVGGPDAVQQVVDMELAGGIDVDAFGADKLTLDDVNGGFELMEAPDGIRSVIDFA